MFVEGQAGGGDFGTGRFTGDVGYRSGSVRDMAVDGILFSFNDGIGGLSLSLDQHARLKGVGMHLGPGFNAGVAGTKTSVCSVRECDWLP